MVSLLAGGNKLGSATGYSAVFSESVVRDSEDYEETYSHSNKLNRGLIKGKEPDAHQISQLQHWEPEHMFNDDYGEKKPNQDRLHLSGKTKKRKKNPFKHSSTKKLFNQ